MKKTHGLTRKNGKKTRIWRIWQCINTRCKNKNRYEYKNYGGRGIKNEWKSFIDFRDDMYKNYLKHCEEYGEKETTIDRVDNNGNYNKRNCKWSTNREQNRNIRKTKRLIFKNKECLLIDLCDMLNINKSTLYSAYYRNQNNNKYFCKNYEFKIPNKSI